MGLLSLPSSFPGVFESVIGHGIGYSGTWIIVRWIEPLSGIFAATLLVALLWSIVNLLAGYERKINAVALGLCLP